MSNVNPVNAIGRSVPGASKSPLNAVAKTASESVKGVLNGHETAIGKPSVPLANHSPYANVAGKAIAMAEAVRVHGDKRVETPEDKKKNAQLDSARHVKLNQSMEKVERKAAARRISKDRSGGTASGIPRSIIKGRA